MFFEIYVWPVRLLGTNSTHSEHIIDKVEEDSLDLIPSPSPFVKIQIIGGKVKVRLC